MQHSVTFLLLGFEIMRQRLMKMQTGSRSNASLTYFTFDLSGTGHFSSRIRSSGHWKSPGNNEFTNNGCITQKRSIQDTIKENETVYKLLVREKITDH